MTIHRILTALLILAAGGCALPPGPATPPPIRPFRFLAIADPHFRNVDHHPQKLQHFQRFLADAEALNPDFVVVLGDVVGEDIPALAQTRKIAAESRIPVHFVHGNHDDPAEFDRVFGRANYSFNHKGCHVVIYDSIRSKPDWLKADFLRIPPGMPVVFCEHYLPSFDTSVRITLDKANTILALSGHIHDHRSGLTGRLRDVNLPPFDEGFAVVDVRIDGTAALAWRKHNIRQCLAIVHPGPDEEIPPGPGRVLANVFDSYRDILQVECDTGSGWKPMSRLTDWTWSADADLGLDHVLIRATDSAGKTALAARSYRKTATASRVRLDGDWPVRGGAPDNRRRAPGLVAPPLQFAWHAAIGGRLNQPVLADRKLYVTASTQDVETNNVVTCLDAVTGSEIWRHSLDGSTLSSPAVTAGRVGAIDQFGHAVGLDAATGRELWQARRVTIPYGTALGDSGGITAADGLFFVGNLNALDARLGEVRWSRPVTSGSSRPPAIAGNRVIGSGGGALLCRRTANGRELWRGGSPGKALWHDDYVGRGTSLFTDDKAILPGAILVDASNGSVERRIPALRPVDDFSLGPDGRILIGSGGRACMAFDLTAPGTNLLWCVSNETAEVSAPVVSGPVVWLGTDAGRLQALDLATGRERYSLDLGAAPQAPIMSGNTIFVAAGGGIWAFTGKEQ